MRHRTQRHHDEIDRSIEPPFERGLRVPPRRNADGTRRPLRAGAWCELSGRGAKIHEGDARRGRLRGSASRPGRIDNRRYRGRLALSVDAIDRLGCGGRDRVRWAVEPFIILRHDRVVAGVLAAEVASESPRPCGLVGARRRGAWTAHGASLSHPDLAPLVWPTMREPVTTRH